MLTTLLNIIWYVLDELFGFLGVIFGAFGIPLVAFVIAIVVISGVFNHILSPFLKNSGNSKKNSSKKGD